LATVLAVIAVGALLSAARQGQPEGQTAQHMREHYGKAIEAQQAVIRGDLDSVKPAADWLAKHEATLELDKASAGQVAQMREAARRAAEADDIPTAAEATASMLATCGTCHRAARVVPPAGADERPRVGGTVGHMLEHQRAVDTMMQGLVVPSATLWREGAEALKAAPLKASDLPRDPGLTRDILAAEDAIHLLADRAATASETPARVKTYGQIIASCARCHGLHGRIWGPGTPR
jgi:cytochrome c553